MLRDYELLDLPSSLTPPSFLFLRPTSSTPPTQPRNPPEPTKKDIQWPQAEELKKLHNRHGTIIEQALKSAQDDGVNNWCNERIQRKVEKDDNDLRQWDEMFKIMRSFENNSERNVILLSDKGSITSCIY